MGIERQVPAVLSMDDFVSFFILPNGFDRLDIKTIEEGEISDLDF